jgi:hypothetical protein
MFADVSIKGFCSCDGDSGLVNNLVSTVGSYWSFEYRIWANMVHSQHSLRRESTVRPYGHGTPRLTRYLWYSDSVMRGVFTMS